ncbi:MAG: hypothetical protein M1358_05895 [Chloroflexi bacterium]|nr:hypothetical protein [Chloroflexota bacterium]
MTDIVGWLAFIFLTLAGYSAGAVLGSRTRGIKGQAERSPTLLDMGIVVALWISGIAVRLAGGEAWVVAGAILLLALMIAFSASRVQPWTAEGKPLTQ